MGHTWVKHREHGGLWRCPDEALDDMAGLGWEITDERPVERSLGDIEREAHAAELAALAAQEAAAERVAKTKSKATDEDVR